jgi:hypothetical protein
MSQQNTGYTAASAWTHIPGCVGGRGLTNYNKNLPHLMIIYTYFVSLFDDNYELFDALFLIVVIIRKPCQLQCT